MNGSENGYAGALFFALISLGAILKIEDLITGGAVGAGGAVLAAICLRRALNRSAQAAEEDHQRMEIQFQQLRNKINETSSASIDAMNSLSDVTQLLRDNLQILHRQSVNLDNFINLLKNSESINSAIAEIEENSFALNTALEKIFVTVQSQEKLSNVTEELKRLAVIEGTLEKIFIAIQSQGQISDVTEELKKIAALDETLEKIFVTVQAQGKFPDVTTDLKNLAGIEETNKTNLQTSLKILHAIAQMIKNSTYSKDLDKINSSLENLGGKNETLDALKTSANDANKNLAELVKINDNFAKSVATGLKELRLAVANLSNKLESIKDTPHENQIPLTAEDLDNLKKIMAKINLK